MERVDLRTQLRNIENKFNGKLNIDFTAESTITSPADLNLLSLGFRYTPSIVGQRINHISPEEFEKILSNNYEKEIREFVIHMLLYEAEQLEKGL